MKKTANHTIKTTFCKWSVLFALVFVISVLMNAQFCQASENTYTVSLSDGYLGLRSAKNYDPNNIIGELYSGDTVEVQDYSDSTYWYVYSPKLGKSGFVNRDYLISSSDTWIVLVDSNYLALRNAKAYDSDNEIGELYTGDTVDIRDSSDPIYWYVYAPRLDAFGYVNKDYLFNSDFPWTVSVNPGYLALRNAKSYDSQNEIGELYTGDTVMVQDSSDSTYWYVYSLKLKKSGYVDKNYLYIEENTPKESWKVSVDSGYLALRSEKVFDPRNEIGELYTGDVVEIQDSSDSPYWYVYSPKLNRSGYVNKNYLYIGENPPSYTTKTVHVDSGYLALRDARAYDSSNEIGELYSGDIVRVQNSSDSLYWYVYAPRLDAFGYVNKDYIS